MEIKKIGQKKVLVGATITKIEFSHKGLNATRITVQHTKKDGTQENRILFCLDSPNEEYPQLATQFDINATVGMTINCVFINNAQGKDIIISFCFDKGAFSVQDDKNDYVVLVGNIAKSKDFAKGTYVSLNINNKWYNVTCWNKTSTDLPLGAHVCICAQKKDKEQNGKVYENYTSIGSIIE